MASSSFHVLLQVAVLQVALQVSNSHSTASAHPSPLDCVDNKETLFKERVPADLNAYFLTNTNEQHTANKIECSNACQANEHCTQCIWNPGECRLVTYKSVTVDCVANKSHLFQHVPANVLAYVLKDTQEGMTENACSGACEDNEDCTQCIWSDNKCALITYNANGKEDEAPEEDEGEKEVAKVGSKRRGRASTQAEMPQVKRRLVHRTRVVEPEYADRLRAKQEVPMDKLRPHPIRRKLYNVGVLVETDAAMVVEGGRLAADAPPLKEEPLAARMALVVPHSQDAGQSAAKKQVEAGAVARPRFLGNAHQQTLKAAEAVEEAAAGEIGITKSQVVSGLSTLSMIKEAAQVLTSYAVDRVR